MVKQIRLLVVAATLLSYIHAAPTNMSYNNRSPFAKRGDSFQCSSDDNPLLMLTHFAAVFFGDFDTDGGQDILGPLAVQSDFKASDYYVNANGDPDCSDPNDITGYARIFNIPIDFGSPFTLKGNNPTNGLDPCRTIFNFYPSDSSGVYSSRDITLKRNTGSNFGGFSLAPEAHIVDGSTGAFSGTVVGQDYSWGGSGVEIHNYSAAGGSCSAFAGCFPIYDDQPLSPVTTETSSAATTNTSTSLKLSFTTEPSVPTTITELSSTVATTSTDSSTSDGTTTTSSKHHHGTTFSTGSSSTDVATSSTVAQVTTTTANHGGQTCLPSWVTATVTVVKYITIRA
ncbi:hypothetical protein MAM1_0178c07339 [Mucor ambiguus]|uniref:Uncharacterized protein n=1 Tax=Mucor ambiguus TaxID=91626 RepID=A0A0C9LW35_9FUNG|nr:hypothetical protein MAM1_0178c07339 [Mucor ambiguus]